MKSMRPPVLPHLHNYVNPSGFSESYCRGTAKFLTFLGNRRVFVFVFSQVLGLLLSLVRREVTDSIEYKGKNIKYNYIWCILNKV